MTVFISDDCIISSMNPRALAKHGTAGTTRCFTLAGTSERRSFQINASVFVSARLASFLYIATPDRMSIKMWGMFDRVSDRMPDHVPGKMSDLWKVRIFMR